MITDLHKGDYGLEGKVRWELFGEEIKVGIDDGAGVEYAEKCAAALNALPEETVKAIFEAAKRYCLFFKDLCGGDWDDWNEMSFKVTEKTPAERFKSEIVPTYLIVEKPRTSGSDFISSAAVLGSRSTGLRSRSLTESSFISEHLRDTARGITLTPMMSGIM